MVVARNRYLAEDAAELVAVDYEPLEAVVEPTDAEAIHERRFHYGDVDDALASADLVVRTTFRVPRFTVFPSNATASSATGTSRRETDRLGELPGAVHAARRRGRRPRPPRRSASTPHAARLGRLVRRQGGGPPYVVLVGLAARALGVPVRWTEDRMEHLAASCAATGRVTEVEAGFTRDGELVALRYDALEDVGAYVRAPEPATLYRMHGSLSGAYRVRNVAARNRVVLTNTVPSGLNRGFGGPQLYFGLERTLAIAARRLGIDPVELARRNLVRAEEMPYRTATGALYDSGDYAACLDRAVELARYAELRVRVDAARAEGRLAGIGLACVVEPSISNMGYITLAQTAVERAATLPKSGNAEGASVAIDPLGGITVRLGTTPQGQGHRTVVAQVVADELGCAPEDITVLSELDTATTPWTVASGELLVAVLRRGRRGGAGRRPPPAGEGRRSARAPRGAGHAAPQGRRDGALAPRGAPGRDGARPRGSCVLRDAEPRSARTPRTASPPPGRTASSSMCARSRSTVRRAR